MSRKWKIVKHNRSGFDGSCSDEASEQVSTGGLPEGEPINQLLRALST